MPSLAHHALVDLFREQPALAPRLLELALGVRLPRGTACRVSDSSLDRLRPLERRADLVLQLMRRGRPVLTMARRPKHSAPAGGRASKSAAPRRARRA